MSNQVIEIKVNNIPQALEALEQKKDEILEVIGGTIEGYAIDLAPVGTPETTGIPGYKGGSLRSTIRTKRENEDTMMILAGGQEGIYRDVNYAVYVEMGTVKMTAQPYLKPAIENHIDEYRRIFERILNE